MSFTYNIQAFMQGRYPLHPFFLHKACCREIYIAKQEEVWGGGSGTSVGFGCGSEVHDAPSVQLFNCFIRRRTGTRNKALMINTQVNTAKKDLHIA